MSKTRREFLTQTAAAAAAAGLAPAAVASAPAAGPVRPAPKKLKILFMGGTGFLGPHTVRALQARGHEVTLFNRGRTNPHLFPELEKIKGDRGKDLSALEGDRTWDFVVDTSGYYPRVVNMLADVVKDRVGAYVFISTMSVYPDWMGANTEESELATLKDPTTEEITGLTYGGLKVLCEQAAEQHWPGRTLNIRPGLIVGPGDNSDRLTWWPLRIHRGGEVIAPGHWDMPVRFIDARDLAEWTVHCMEQQIFGPFNAIGPEGGLNMAELLFGCKVVLGAECNFTWVTNEFLAEQGVRPWAGPDSIPIWVPMEPPFEVSSWEKARKAGLSHRPTGDTLRDTLKWALEERDADRPWRAGITPEREEQLLKDWKTWTPKPAAETEGAEHGEHGEGEEHGG